MMQLRPYQQDAVDCIRNHFATGKRKVILCLPTGAGKTVTFADLVSRTIKKNMSARVLILTHRMELTDQAAKTLRNFGINYEPITKENKRINLYARCYVGMVETYYKRIQKHPELLNIDLVIIDEAHTGNFKKLFDYWKAHSPNTYVIGATATPISSKKSDPLSNYYEDIVCPVSISDLIDNEFLMPAITYSVKGADVSKLEIDKGEYTDASLMDAFAKRTIYSNLIAKYQQFCLDEERPIKAVVFNVNVQHSLEVTEEFNRAGIPARHIDANTEKGERDSIIAAFKSGAFPVICNVGILNAGFDDPSVGVVVVNRATTSLSLWLQMCGRGSRLSPGKTHFKILDMGLNYKDPNLGLWEKDRDWTQLWDKKGKTKEGEGISPVKECPACEALIKISAKVCEHCGHVYPEKEPEQVPDAEFEVVNDGLEILAKDRKENWPLLSIPDLVQLRELKGRKAEWVVHVIRDRCKTQDQFRSQLTELAHINGYKPGWVYHRVQNF